MNDQYLYKIFSNKLNLAIALNEKITQLKIKDVIDYRYIATHYETDLILSFNNEPIDLLKNAIIIDNLFNLDLNSQKNIKIIIKKLCNEISDDNKKMLENNSTELSKIIEIICMNSDYDLNFDMDFSIEKTLLNSKIRFFEQEGLNYFEVLINYLKNMILLSNNKIIISFGLLGILTIEEKELLKAELNSLDIYLIDYSLCDILKIVKEDEISIKDSNNWCII